MKVNNLSGEVGGGMVSLESTSGRNDTNDALVCGWWIDVRRFGLVMKKGFDIS